MSLINRVLTDLERRGATTRTDGVTVRAVHVANRRHKVIIATLLVLLLAGIAGMWAGLRDRPPPPASAYPDMPNEDTGQTSVAQVPATQIHAKRDEVGLNPAGKQHGGKKQFQMQMSRELSSVPRPTVLPGRQSVQTRAAQALTSQQEIETARPTVSMADDPGPQVIAAAAGIDSAKPAVPVPNGPNPKQMSAPGIDKQVRQATVQQRAESEFRKANGLMQQGRSEEAIAGYRSALQLDAGHEAARQAMVGLLLESKRNTDAERVLQEGLDYNPKQSGFAMMLARLQVERNALPQALETLQTTLPYAEQQADYQALIAAILQRLDRHKQAIEHYQTALRLSPNSGVWLMGLGISLQAEKREDAARAAYRQAIDSHMLNPDLKSFVTRRLQELAH